MAVPTGQRARRRRPQSVQSSLHSSCTSSLCSYLSGLRRLLHSTWYWAFSRIGSMAVSPPRGTAVLTHGRHLNFESTQPGFPSLGTLEPRDIGTPSRSTGTLEPWDIGTSSAQGGERAPTREPAKGTDPKNGIFQVSPRASSAVSPAAWFMAKPLMEVTTSWVGACWLQVQFFWSRFPETLRRGAVPQQQSELMGRERKFKGESVRSVSD